MYLRNGDERRRIRSPSLGWSFWGRTGIAETQRLHVVAIYGCVAAWGISHDSDRSRRMPPKRSPRSIPIQHHLSSNHNQPLEFLTELPEEAYLDLKKPSRIDGYSMVFLWSDCDRSQPPGSGLVRRSSGPSTGISPHPKVSGLRREKVS